MTKLPHIIIIAETLVMTATRFIDNALSAAIMAAPAQQHILIKISCDLLTKILGEAGASLITNSSIFNLKVFLIKHTKILYNPKTPPLINTVPIIFEIVSLYAGKISSTNRNSIINQKEPIIKYKFVQPPAARAITLG